MPFISCAAVECHATTIWLRSAIDAIVLVQSIEILLVQAKNCVSCDRPSIFHSILWLIRNIVVVMISSCVSSVLASIHWLEWRTVMALMMVERRLMMQPEEGTCVER